MLAHFPAPKLCQFADEEIIIEISSIVYPGFVDRVHGVNGLRLTLEGDYRDERLIKMAGGQFQILLGALRAWHPMAGQRADEVRPEIGEGTIRDEQGNQILKCGVAIAYATSSLELKRYGDLVKLAIFHSTHLAEALWLNGRRDRNAADLYMIYEHAESDLQGRTAIVEALKISDNDISRLTKSTNNLAPTEGGRHAKATGVPEWSLDRQKEFIGRFLKVWVSFRAINAS